MKGPPTAKQEARARELGISLEQCRTSREAHRAICLTIHQREMKIAQKMGIRPGVFVRGFWDGNSLGRIGKVRYVKIPEGEAFDSLTPQVVGVDWMKPRRHFSRVRAVSLTVVDESEGI